MPAASMRIAGLGIEVRCGLPEYVSLLHTSFDDDEGGGLQGTFTVTITPVLELPPRDDGVLPKGSRRFHLAGRQEYVYHAETRSYDMGIADSVRGVIDLEGETASYEAAPGLQPRTVLHVMLLDPLSLILPRYDGLILHAAAVSTPKGAAVLIGQSGVGKSTLGFLLSHATADGSIRHMADDTLFLIFQGGGAMVHPIRSGFGLSEALLRAHGVSLTEADVLQRSREKAYVHQLPYQDRGPAQAARLVFLEHGDTPDRGTAVMPQGRAGALQRLLDSQTTIASPYMVKRLQLLNRLAAGVPASVCRYPEYCDVDVLRGLLLGGDL